MTAPSITWKDAQPVDGTDLRVARLVDALWRDHFADVPRVNEIRAGYGYTWKRRLGRIRMSLDEQESEIVLNGLLDSPGVPDVIRIAILAHEIVHYAQGFGSPLPRAQAHAHKHGAVTCGLDERGLAWTERMLSEWAFRMWPRFAQAERVRRQALASANRTPCATAAEVVY